MKIYRSATKKPVSQFVNDLRKVARTQGFSIYNEAKMEMARVFVHHGVDVPKDFDLHMVQICKPEKAAKSLSKNPERSVLMPKFIMVFSRDGLTQLRFAYHTTETVRALVDDDEFPASLAESYRQIIGLIEAAQ